MPSWVEDLLNICEEHRFLDEIVEADWGMVRYKMNEADIRRRISELGKELENLSSDLNRLQEEKSFQTTRVNRSKNDKDFEEIRVERTREKSLRVQVVNPFDGLVVASLFVKKDL